MTALRKVLRRSSSEISLPSKYVGHHRVVVLRDLFDEIMAMLCHRLRHVRRDRDLHDLLAVLAFEGVRLVFEKVHHRAEIALGADRQLDGNRVRRQTINNRLEALFKIRAGAVELVDKADARHFVVVRVAPVGLRLRLNAGDAVKDDDRAVQHTQRALYLHGKVDVARGVDEVDAMLEVFMIGARGVIRWRPERGRCSGCDRDAALALLLHPVHDSVARVHLADLVLTPV